jgi:hypothetical protein
VDQPLALSGLESTNRSLQTLLKTVVPGTEYELQVTLGAPFKLGSLTVPVSLKTSLTNLPLIKIPVVIVVQSPIATTPPEITVPPGPLPSENKSSVTIQNNRAESLALSEPVANVPGVKVSLREIQPGRQFVLEANFPAGFQLQHGQNVHIRVKTSDPKIPVVTVPVFQTRHLAALLKAQSSNQMAPGHDELGKEN